MSPTWRCNQHEGKMVVAQHLLLQCRSKQTNKTKKPWESFPLHLISAKNNFQYVGKWIVRNGFEEKSTMKNPARVRKTLPFSIFFVWVSSDSALQWFFFLSSCQIHLAMAPWGATDGRATVPLDPVEDGKFGQQPFFHSKTKPPNSRTTSRRPNILLSYGSTIHVSHATAYEISPVHASNYLQKDCT